MSDNTEFWQSCWDNDAATWHQKEPHDMLVKFYEKWTNGMDPKSTRVLLPLCGKSVDMKWLHEKGHTVIGIELIKEGVMQFFQENGIEYDVENVNGMDKYISKDGRLILLNGDIYKVTPEMMGGPVDLLFDRGSMVALPAANQDNYAKQMISLVGPEARYLLEVFEYDKTAYPGPPRCIVKEEVEHCFDQEFHVNQIHSMEEKNPFKLDYFAKVLYLMSKKQG